MMVKSTTHELCAPKHAVFPRAAQAALEEAVRAEAAEGELRLSDEQQAEFYRIQEEAGSRTAKLRADHAALQAAQARFGPCFRFRLQAHAAKTKKCGAGLGVTLQCMGALL